MKKILGVLLIAFQLLQISPPSQAFAAESAVTESYQASAGFSSVQGQNGWYYQQWDGTAYKDMNWDSAASIWRGSYYYALVAKTSQHPDMNDSVRTWKAPHAGAIRVTGNVAKENISCGNGVIVKMLRNDETIWSATVAAADARGYDLNETLSVKNGDMIRFVVNKNGSQPMDNWCDGTRWDPMITYQPQYMSYYNTTGQLTSTLQPQGAHMEYEYDTNGNLLRKYNTGNLLANGSFENAGGTAGLAEHWFTWASSGSFTRQTAASGSAESGLKSQEISASQLRKDQLFVLYQPVALTPNQPVIASGRILVNELKNAKVIYIVDFFDQSNNWVGNLVSSELTAPTNRYLTLSATGNVPATAVKGSAQVFIIGTSATEDGFGKVTADMLSLRYESGDNLLVNAGFDHYTDPQRQADGWMIWKGGSYYDATTAAANKDVGSKAQKIDIPSLPPGAQYVLHQVVSVKPGAAIQGGIKVKVESLERAQVFYDIDFLDANFQYISNLVSGVLTVPTTGFTELNASGTVPANAVMANVSFFIRADSTGGNGTVLVDSATLKMSK